MRALSFFVVIAIASGAAAQEAVVPPDALVVGPTVTSPPVSNTVIPSGIPVTPPPTGQSPGSSVVYLPQGTPAVVTPSTAIGYSPVGTPVVIVNQTHDSVIAKLADQTKIEIDSDNSVYQVFADGSRASLADGVHTMSDGRSITTKDGKQVP